MDGMEEDEIAPLREDEAEEEEKKKKVDRHTMEWNWRSECCCSLGISYYLSTPNKSLHNGKEHTGLIPSHTCTTLGRSPTTARRRRSALIVGIII